jgi:spermidine synthase
MSLSLAIVLAGLCGGISLSYEILWFRVYSFASGGSPQDFGLLLGYYLAGLALGAYASRRFCETRQVARDAPPVSLTWFLLAASVAGYLLIPALAWLVTMTASGHLFGLVTVAAAMFGALLPLIAHAAIPPDDQAGLRVSFVYLSNILGSAAGSLLTGFVLLDVWTTQELAIRLLLVSLCLTVIVVLRARIQRQRLLICVAVAGAAFAAVATAPRIFDRLYERLLFQDLDGGARFERLVENKEGVIAVTKDRRVFGGGAYDGYIAIDLVHDPNLILRAFVAAALHPHPRRVLMVGLSTGAWAQVIAAQPGVEQLTIVEINPGYLQLIAQYPEVRSLLSNPKVRIVVDDGRRWLVQHPDSRFELIVQNTTEHWRAHTTNLLSKEYQTMVRRHLADGGVFYYNTTDSQDAYKTSFTLFQHGLRFVNFVAASDVPITLDSTSWHDVLTTTEIDHHLVLDLAQSPDRARFAFLKTLPGTLDESPRRFGFERREALLKRLPGARIITDDNMLPEWHTSVVTW